MVARIAPVVARLVIASTESVGLLTELAQIVLGRTVVAGTGFGDHLTAVEGIAPEQPVAACIGSEDQYTVVGDIALPVERVVVARIALVVACIGFE